MSMFKEEIIKEINKTAFCHHCKTTMVYHLSDGLWNPVGQMRSDIGSKFIKFKCPKCGRRKNGDADVELVKYKGQDVWLITKVYFK